MLDRTIVAVALLAALGIACSVAEDPIGADSAALSACNPGYVYCGEHTRIRAELVADARPTGDLYRCTEERTLTAVERCTSGCDVRSAGEDDACKGAASAAPDLAVFPPRAGSQIYGRNAVGTFAPRNAPRSLVMDPSVDYFVLAPAPREDGVTVYNDELRIDRQSGMCETADKVRVSGVLGDNPDHAADAPGIRKLLRFDAAVLNAGTTAIPFGGPGTSVDRSTGATSSRLVDRRLFGYSACHAHDHMNGFAIYRLVDAQGAPVARGNVQVTGRKQGFCIGDTIQYGSGPDPIASLVNNRCYDMVISPGFADVYAREDSVHKRFLGGQWIDVTGVTPGSYTVEVEVNPPLPLGADGECSGGYVKCGTACRLFCEADYGNNVGKASVTIPPTPCFPTDVNDGSTINPTSRLSAPEATFRQRLVELSARVSSTCGPVVGSVACTANVSAGSDLLTARTQNGCTLRYRWDLYKTGTVGAPSASGIAAAELEVEQGCAKTYDGQRCSATVTSSCYDRPECTPAKEYYDVWKDSCGASYKTRVPSADSACP